MANKLVVVLLLTTGHIITGRQADNNGVTSVSISLLVELDEQCTTDIEEITNDVRSHVIKMCNCTVISGSLECCAQYHAVYKFNLSHTASSLGFDSSSTHIVMLQQCYHGNCTCDSNATSSDDQQIVFLILAIICGSLLVLVLSLLLVVCYKCHQLNHEREKVLKMSPCPAPMLSNSIRQWPTLQEMGSSAYIGPADIASPTLQPSLSRCNNPCCRVNDNMACSVGVQTSFTEQSTTVELQPTLNSIESTSSTITPQQEVAVDDSNRRKDHSVPNNDMLPSQKCKISLLHGNITTPSGLVATLNGSINIVSSEKYPGYVDHTINDK